MTRLNNNIRQKILHNALKQAGVTEREAKIRTRRSDLAEACRIESIGGVEVEKEVKRLEEKFDKLQKQVPSEIQCSCEFRIYTDYECEVAFGGMQINLQFNGDKNRMVDSKKVFKSPVSRNRKLFAADHEFSIEFDEITKESDATKSLRDSVTANVNAVLNSVTTIKKLLEVWPESKELIPQNVDSPKINLPSVNVDQLNTMIGIPTE